MLIYTLLINFATICIGIILIILGNLIKISDGLQVFLTKYSSDANKSRIKELVNLLGNLLLATGVILVMAMLYYLLFVMYF
jgi:hypothetical protein